MKTFAFLGFMLLFFINTKAQQVVIDSVQYKDSYRTVRLYLPQDYDKLTYPLLYMLDGQNLFDDKTSYAGEWQVDEIIQLAFPKRQAIVIGIDHGNEKRIDELTPYVNEKYGGGKADEFLSWILNEVRPFVIKKYNLSINTHQIAIAGSSLGGLFAHYAAIKHPDYFQTAGVLSPSFWWSEECYKLAKDRDYQNRQHFIFMAGDSESEEMLPDMRRMHDLMFNKYTTVSYTVDEKGEHNEKTWRGLFATFYDNWLKWL